MNHELCRLTLFVNIESDSSQDHKRKMNNKSQQQQQFSFKLLKCEVLSEEAAVMKGIAFAIVALFFLETVSGFPIEDNWVEDTTGVWAVSHGTATGSGERNLAHKVLKTVDEKQRKGNDETQEEKEEDYRASSAAKRVLRDEDEKDTETVTKKASNSSSAKKPLEGSAAEKKEDAEGSRSKSQRKAPKGQSEVLTRS